MKFERIVKQEVEVVSLHADIGVRYFEDASVNGIDEEDDAPKMPLISGGRNTGNRRLLFSGVLDHFLTPKIPCFSHEKNVV